MVISCPWCGCKIHNLDVCDTQDEVFSDNARTVVGWEFVCPHCQGGIHLPMPDPNTAPHSPERVVKILPSRFALVAIIADLREEMA